MDTILRFDEVELPLDEEIDDEISLYWDNDEIEEKFDPDYPPERYRHLKIPKHKLTRAR